MDQGTELDMCAIEGALREEENGLEVAKVLEARAEPGVGKYNNYLSDILRLQLRVELKGGGEAALGAILKQQLQGEAAQAVPSLADAYQTEILVYRCVIKEMDKLLGDLKEERLWPQYYGCYGNNILLEDLKELGYRLTQKHSEHDRPHAELAMRALGQFHALSMVLVERGLFNPHRLKPLMFARDLPFFNKFYNSAVDVLVNSIPSWGPEWQDFPVLLRSAVTDVGLKLKSLWEKTQSQYAVINHGDCWSNNMMFKYQDGTNTPVHVRLLDLQLSHYCSLGWDLNYYLHTTSYPDSRKRYLTPLLETYVQSLSETCTKLDYAGHIFTLSEVEDALHQVRFFAFITAITDIPIHMCSGDEDFHFSLEDYFDEKPIPNDSLPEKVICVLKKILLEFKDYGII